MNQSPIYKPRGTIAGLHYLRAFATIMVVVVHSCTIASHPELFKTQPFGGFFSFGVGEIELFFMMSGFIMLAVTYDPQKNVPRIKALDFLKKRAIRLIPMLWIAVLSYAVLRYFGGGAVRVDNVLRGLFIWPVGMADPNVVWTIKYEVLFYLLFAFFFLYKPKLKWYIALWFFAPLGISLLNGKLIVAEDTFTSFFFSIYNVLFACGVLVCVLYRRFGQAYFNMNRWVLLAAILSIMISARVLMFVFFPDPHAWFATLALILLLCPFCMAATTMAVFGNSDREFKTLIFLGDASYSIFLFHPHIVTPFLGILKHFAPNLPSAAAAAITVAVALIAGSIIHILIEKPILARSHVLLHSFPKPRRVLAKTEAFNS